MTTLDKVYDQIKQLQGSGHYPDGISAQGLASCIGVKRSTASFYLNELVDQGRLEKYDTRPVLFSLPDRRLSIKDFSDLVLDGIIGAKHSLKTTIDLCKSAVIYPPNGLPVLINGNSGTGKSFLAAKIHEYAIQQSIVPADAKYVELNCADYASNPQLLSSVLFGHVKGAFTGASDMKSGLVAQADGGYLFLDEVHRLSFESQEKLFLLMDQSRYRMLGENSGWHAAKVRFIFATTEDPDKVFLKTLLRRIPVHVTLPDWNARPLWERLQLIYVMFHTEAEVLERDFYLPASSVNYLLQHNSDGNIGSIRNIIRISCAQAYRDMTDSKILTITLLPPSNISNAGVKPQLIDFTPSLEIRRNDKLYPLPKITLPFEKEIHTLVSGLENSDYKTIKRNAYHLLGQMRIAAGEYFPQYHSQERGNPQIYYYRKLIDNIMQNISALYGIKQGEIDDNFLILFLFDIFEGFSLSDHEKSIIAINAEHYRRKTGYLTHNIILLLKESLQSDYGFLRFFLPLLLAPVLQEIPSIAAAIVSRGSTTASDIANTVNKIHNNYIFDGLDIPIENNGITEIVEKVRRYISRVDTSCGLLLLVDQDSPDDMYEPIRNHLQGELAIVNSISTNLALNLGYIMCTGCDFSTLVVQAKELTAFQVHYFEKNTKGSKMVVSCISGVGIAGIIADVFRKYIKNPNLEIVTLDYKTLTHILEYDDTQALNDTRLIITINDITSDKVSILPTHELPGRKGMALIKRQLGDYIDDDSIHLIIKDIGILFSVEGIATSLSVLDPHKIVADVGNCIESYESHYGIRFSSSTRMNLFFHISLMVERLMLYDEKETYHVFTTRAAALRTFEENSKLILAPLIKKYNIRINEDEVEMIFEIVKYDLAFDKG